MALTDDQRAMLRLLAQRGEEGYEDIAALMGITVEEVRERVREALVEVAEPEPAATPSPPSPPSPEASPPEPPKPAPTEPASTPQPVDRPAPAPSVTPPAPRPSGGKRQSRFAGVKLPKDRGALIGLGAGALAVVAFVIILLVSGGSDSSSSDSGTASEAGQGGTTPAASNNPNLTQAVLSPVDGGDAKGTALFGRFKKNVLLQVTAEGLDPSQSGQSYAIWLSHSGNAMVPVGTAKVPDSGDLAARFQIPAAVLVLVARGAFDEIDVTRTTDSALSAAIAKARKSKSESAYTGTDVLRGEITGPFVDAAKK